MTTASTTRTRGRVGLRRAVLLALGATVIGVATPAAISAAPPSKCKPSPPSVHVHNTYAWSSFGTWAQPGQRVPYLLEVINSTCSTTTVTAAIGVPLGFTVEPASLSVSLRAGRSTLQTVYVTSPTDAPAIDNAVVVTPRTTARDGSVVTGNSETSYYKVYTSDSAAPTAYWQSNRTGGTVSGTVQLMNNFQDDHLARRAELYIDGAFVNSVTNDGITYSLSLNHNWDTRSLSKGQHTVEWKAYDDVDNTLVDTWVLTVQ